MSITQISFYFPRKQSNAIPVNNKYIMFWLPLILTPTLLAVVPDVLFAVLDGVVVPNVVFAITDVVVVPVGPLVVSSRPKENDNKEKITILARIIDFILAKY